MRTPLLLLLAACLSISAAAQITVSRIAPENATFGQEVEVELVITNEGPDATAIVREKVTGLDVKEKPLIRSETYYDDYGEHGGYGGTGLTVSVLEWRVSLSSGETKAVEYHILANSLGPITLPPTQVFAQDDVYREDAQTIVVLCSPDDMCDLSVGENYLNCPDCTTGLPDGMCDLAADGRNDPDCEYRADPDYNETEDTDRDGVLDGMDECTLTPHNEKADSRGCSCSQKHCFDDDLQTMDSCIPETAECVHQAPEAEPSTQETTSQAHQPAGEPAPAKPLDTSLVLAIAAIAIAVVAGLRFMRVKRK